MNNKQLTEYFLNNGVHLSDIEIQTEIDSLRSVIIFHNQKYYSEDDPIISDAKYDFSV